MRWLWIDRIIEHVPGERLVAIKNVSLAEEHLHDHGVGEAGGAPVLVMPTSLLIEGMAQTAGILVGAANRFREKVILAKIVRAELDRDVFPGDTVRFEAVVDRIETAGAATTGSVARLDHADAEGTWEPIGRVDLLFSHIDRNRAGLEFPEGNFVFSDNFRAIIGVGGLGDVGPDDGQETDPC